MCTFTCYYYGAYAEDAYGQQRFPRVKAPTHQELNALVNTPRHRIARCLEKCGLLEHDVENTRLTLELAEDDVLTQLHGHSVSYRIATGSQLGRMVFTLQTLPSCEGGQQTYGQAAKVSCFSLHAGVMAEAHQRDKLARLCRYVSRPACGFEKVPDVNL